MQVLTWYIGDQLFGMELDQCREVVQDRTITGVPYSREFVAGIVNLRGDVVTVLDLARILGYQGENGHSNYVIIRLKSESKNVAIKADRIFDILEIEKNRLEPPPAHLNELETKYVLGVGMTDRGLVVLLNAIQLLEIS